MKEHGCIYGWMNGTKSDDTIFLSRLRLLRIFMVAWGTQYLSNNDKRLGAVCHLPIYIQFIQLGIPTMGPTPGGGIMPKFTLSEPGYSEPWLLRSYLEPGYTEHNHFVVFNIGDKPKKFRPRTPGKIFHLFLFQQKGSPRPIRSPIVPYKTVLGHLDTE